MSAALKIVREDGTSSSVLPPAQNAEPKPVSDRWDRVLREAKRILKADPYAVFAAIQELRAGDAEFVDATNPQIGAMCNKTRGNIKKWLKVIEDAGLITRERAPDGRRRIRILYALATRRPVQRELPLSSQEPPEGGSDTAQGVARIRSTPGAHARHPWRASDPPLARMRATPHKRNARGDLKRESETKTRSLSSSERAPAAAACCPGGPPPQPASREEQTTPGILAGAPLQGGRVQADPPGQVSAGVPTMSMRFESQAELLERYELAAADPAHPDHERAKRWLPTLRSQVQPFLPRAKDRAMALGREASASTSRDEQLAWLEARAKAREASGMAKAPSPGANREKETPEDGGETQASPPIVP